MSHLMTCGDAPNCTWTGLAFPTLAGVNCAKHCSRAAQGAYLEVEYIRNVLSVSGTLKYADSGTA